MKNRRGLLQLEGLTERIVPAVSIRAVDGDLVISGIANLNAGTPTLWVTVSADNTVNIRDGGATATSTTSTTVIDRGTYTVTGDLIFNLSNRADKLTIDFSATATLDGGITANLNNGDDIIAFTNSGVDDVTISGDITVDGGNGNDTLTINNQSNAADTTYSIGGAVSFNGGAGADVFDANRTVTSATKQAALTIGNGLILTRVNTARIGTTVAAGEAPVTIDGNLTFNASVDKLVANTVTLGSATADAVTLAGALTLTGGQGLDTVAWNNLSVVDVIPAEDTVLEVNVNLGLGVNSLSLTDTEIGISGTDADFAFTGGTGADTVTLVGTGNTVSGSVTVTLGKGANTYTDNGSAFDKNLTITGSDNADTIDLNAAKIGGLLSVSLGKGANGLNLDAGGAVDGGLTYVGGSGVDTVTIATGDDLAGDVTISMGTGADVLALTGFTSGNETVTSITIDLGVDSLIDTVTYSLALSTDGIWTDPLNLGSTDSVSTV